MNEPTPADTNRVLADIRAESQRIAADSAAVSEMDPTLAALTDLNVTLNRDLLPRLRALQAKREHVERLRRDLAAAKGER